MSKARPVARQRKKDLVQSVAALDLATESSNPQVRHALNVLICAVAEQHPEELADLSADTLHFATSQDRLRERAFRAVLVALNTDDDEQREAVERLIDVVARKHPRHFLTTS